MIAANAADPQRALEAIFSGVATQAANPACLGCAFLGAASEFPEVDHPSHQKALEHKRAVLARFEELARAAGARDPERLAEGLLLLMDGAWGAIRMFGPGSYATRVTDSARALIAAQIRP